MKRTARYLLFEMFPIFLMGNFFFMFLLLLEKLITLADLFFAKNVPLSLILETVAYLMPSLFTITIPLAALLGVLIAFSRLSADSELIAMRAIGASNMSLLKPVIMFGFIVGGLCMLMSVYLSEKGTTMALNNLNKIVENISINDIKEKEMYSQLPGLLIYVEKKINKSNFAGVVMIRTNDSTIISASRGLISPTAQKSMEMIFNDGRITMIDKKNETTSIGFETMSLNLPLAIDIAKAVDSPLTMSVKDLIANAKTNPKAAFELSKRFAMPVSAILMALFGFSLGVFLSRSGKNIGVVVSIGIAFIFNFMMILLENTASKSFLPPLLSPWVPIAILSVMLAYFLKRSFR